MATSFSYEDTTPWPPPHLRRGIARHLGCIELDAFSPVLIEADDRSWTADRGVLSAATPGRSLPARSRDRSFSGLPCSPLASQFIDGSASHLSKYPVFCNIPASFAINELPCARFRPSSILESGAGIPPQAT